MRKRINHHNVQLFHRKFDQLSDIVDEENQCGSREIDPNYLLNRQTIRPEEFIRRIERRTVTMVWNKQWLNDSSMYQGYRLFNNC